MSNRFVFVRYGADRSWEVYTDDSGEPISTHATEGEAERAATRYARTIGGGNVVIHDRYCRVRVRGRRLQLPRPLARRRDPPRHAR